MLPRSGIFIRRNLFVSGKVGCGVKRGSPPPSNPSQCLVHSPQKKRALLPSFFVAEREGFAPLADAPRQTAGVRCLVCVQSVRVFEFLRKLLAPARISTLESLSIFSSFATKKEGYVALFFVAEREGFEPPDSCPSTVFKFYSAFVVFRLLLLFSSPNCRKISVLTALLFDNSGFLLCFGIVSHSLALLIFSAFLTAFCRDFVDE